MDDNKWGVYKHDLGPLMRPWVASAPENKQPGFFCTFDTHAEAIAFVHEQLSDR